MVIRGELADQFEVITNLSRAHAAREHDAWLGYLADPRVELLTSTVTEAGYRQLPSGALDVERPDVAADVAALRVDLRAPVSTVPARLVAGLAARRAVDAGPISLIPCDNLPNNGAAMARVIHELAELVDPTLLGWLDSSTSYLTTMVDRITPHSTADDLRIVSDRNGISDHAPVVTEPFAEWVITGKFAGRRPAWQDAGARFTDDIAPFEHRKLWLLNGGHSLLAYAGSLLGHRTIAEAVADERCSSWLDQWWAEASQHLPQPGDQIATYQHDLRVRFRNPRIRHLLSQIAADGSQKLPVRLFPALRAERAAGRVPEGSTRILAAWLLHLRGASAPVSDPRAAELATLASGSLASAARAVIGRLDERLAADDEVIAAVAHQGRELNQLTAS